MKRIDKVDVQIIKLLQKDGRMPNTEIAKQVGITEGAVRKRMGKLIQGKVIQVVAVGNLFNLGYGVSGFLILHTGFKNTGHVIEQLQKIGNIWLIATIMGGGGNIDLEFFVNNFEEFNRLLGQISRIDGIQKIEQHLYTEIIKEDYNWEAMHDGDD